MIKAYCVKCGKEDKEKGKNKVMQNPVIKRTSRGGYMAQGTCPDCGTKMSVIMSKENAEKAIAEGIAKKEY